MFLETVVIQGSPNSWKLFANTQRHLVENGMTFYQITVFRTLLE